MSRRQMEEEEKTVPIVYSSIFPLSYNASMSCLSQASWNCGIAELWKSWPRCSRARRGREA